MAVGNRVNLGYRHGHKWHDMVIETQTSTTVSFTSNRKEGDIHHKQAQRTARVTRNLSFPFLSFPFLPFPRVAVLSLRFPSLWAKLNRETVDSADLDDSVRFFSRSGSLTSPSHSSLMWMGDQLVTFDGYDGLASAVRGMMTYGFSGFSLAHSDVRALQPPTLNTRDSNMSGNV